MSLNTQNLLKKEVLILEDSLICQRAYQAICKRIGVGADIVNDTEKALHLFKQTDACYKLIILDDNIPSSSGIECTKKMRNFENTIYRQRAHFILCSAHTTSNHLSQNDAALFAEIILKPLTLTHMKQLVSRYLIPADNRLIELRQNVLPFTHMTNFK